MRHIGHSTALHPVASNEESPGRVITEGSGGMEPSQAPPGGQVMVQYTRRSWKPLQDTLRSEAGGRQLKEARRNCHPSSPYFKDSVASSV